MEEKVCSHDKYGHCKFGNQCKKHHYKKICQNLALCQNKDVCNKRHPKYCKRFKSDSFCRFENRCSYFHPEKSDMDYRNIVGKMQIKMLNLEITTKKNPAYGRH